MIEALVRRFEQSGFEVRVFPGFPSRILVRKVCSEDRMIGYCWAISQIDLQNSGLNDYLFDEADHIIALLNAAMQAAGQVSSL